MNNLLAASSIQIAPSGGFTGLGTGVLSKPTGSGISNLSSVISMAVGVMTVVAIIWFIFIFMTGAISIISSGGDKQALEGAKKRITTGIIGLVVVIIALFILDLVGNVLGINILDLNALFGQIVSIK